MMRTIASLTTLIALSLGLTACGDDKGLTTDSTINTTPMTTGDSETGTSTGTTGTGTGTGTTVATVEPTTTDPGTTTESGTTTTDPSTTTTGPGTTTTTDPGTTTGGGADLYGPCDAMNMCPESQDCLSVMGIEGNFCSPKCDAMTDCPAANVAAMPNCALTMGMAMDPTNCALICKPNGTDCPDGMTCKAVPMQMGVGLCTAP